MRKYSNSRDKRIGEQIQKDLMDILRVRVKDPRAKWITITDVEVKPDFSWAKIFYTTMDDNLREDAGKALDSARGFIRSELSKGFKTYSIPQLKFVYDESLERGSKILSIINQVSMAMETEEQATDEETSVEKQSDDIENTDNKDGQ